MPDNRDMTQPSLPDFINSLGRVGTVARELGVSYSTVCGWKAEGVLPSFRAIQISKKFGVPMDDLEPFIREPKRAAS